MLSIGPMVSEGYYLSLAAEDYYLNGGEPQGIWTGRGAEMLGLRGIVHPDDFLNLYQGKHPDGTRLVQSAGQRNHQAGWDFTFSAPKSVSVVWSRAQAQDRRAIQKIQQQAVEEAIAFAEEHFACCRTGHAGMGERVKAGLVVGTFEHGTSRASDPQLHTHALIFNIGVAADGKTRTIVSRILYQQKMVLGAFYRARLAHELEKQLGLRTRRHGNSFEIEGVPQEVIDANSTRRKQILQKLHESARGGAKAASLAALETRQVKDVLPRSELLEQWQASYDAMGFTEAEIAKLIHAEMRDNRALIPQALKIATDNLTRTKPYFLAKDFLFQALCAAAELGIAPQDMLDQVDQQLADSKELIPIRKPNGETVFTTAANIDAEKNLLKVATKMTKRRGAKVSARTEKRILKKHNTLNEEQQAAFEHLIHSKSSVRFLHGMAGTGKTSYTLRACVEAWQRQGYEVIGATPTGKAAQVLQEETGIRCETIHSTLADFDMKKGFIARHHLKQIGRALKGKKTYAPSKPKPIGVGKKTILVVDEAGMVNTRHFQMLMDHVQKGGGTLVFIGDAYQLPPVEGTAPFLSLSRRIGFEKLTDIKRQKEIWAREAARLFAEGEAGKALAMYAERKLITTYDDKDSALQALVNEWAKTGVTTPRKSTILTLTNKESDAANLLCQERRLAAMTKKKRVAVTATDTRDDGLHQCQLYPGDRVLFTRNSKQHGVKNGTLGTISKAHVFSNSVSVELDSGPMVKIPLDSFPHVRLGYAMTTHKSQGTTLEDVHLLVGGYLQNLPSSYVQATRARGTTRFYTTKNLFDDYQTAEESILAKQMSERPDLRLVMDLYQHAEYASENRDEVVNKLLTDWSSKMKAGTEQTFIVTDNQDQASELNQRCHELLTSQTHSGRPLPSITTKHGVEMVPGTKLKFNHPMLQGSVKQGDLATVTRVDRDNGEVEMLVHRLQKRFQTHRDKLVSVDHAYARQLKDEQWLDEHRKSERQQPSQGNLRFSDYVSQQYEPIQTPPDDNLIGQQAFTPQKLWAYEPPPVNAIPPPDQQLYAHMGAGDIHARNQHLQALEKAQQLLEAETQALAQRQTHSIEILRQSIEQRY